MESENPNLFELLEKEVAHEKKCFINYFFINEFIFIVYNTKFELNYISYVNKFVYWS